MRTIAGKRAEGFVRKLEQRSATGLAKVEKQVRRIVDDVRKNGDRALRRYAKKWDGLAEKQSLHVTQDELQKAWETVAEDFREALRTAAANIRQYCERQKPQDWPISMQPGSQV